MTLLNGSIISKKILSKLKKDIAKLDTDLRLDVILIGNNYGSQKYVKMKQKAALDIGIKSTVHRFPESATNQEILSLIKQLNNDSNVTGFMIQLPLPKQFNRNAILEAIDYKKDVDGLTSHNLGLIFQNNEYLIPATPMGILTLLNEYGITLEGKTVAVIGRSSIVGTPMDGLLTNRNATVTVCHSKTINIKEITKRSDIIISATGTPHLVTADWVKENAIVIDAGIAKDPKSGKLTGDVDFEEVKNKASFITPVPGGVGPMTIASLISNTYESFKKKQT